jgi:hypothetical protein
VSSEGEILENKLNPKPSNDPVITLISGRLSALKQSNLTADGSEQTVLEFMDVGRVMGYVDLGNMQAGDAVVVRQYMKVVDGGNYRKYADGTYTDVQPDPLLYINPRETDVAIKITLQQIAGAFKSFPNNFMREL